MRVQVVHSGNAWILRRLARYLVEGLPYVHGSACRASALQRFDLTYYVNFQLLRRPRGRIGNTGSVAGFMALPALGPYAVSKHAMEAFSDSLRRELRPWGIEVSLLEPGPILTDIWQKGVSDGDALQQTLSPQALADYGPLLAALRRVAARAQRDAAPPEVVTRAVVHAFTASRPKTRYLMGTGAGIRQWIARLPDRWQDALVAKALRL